VRRVVVLSLLAALCVGAAAVQRAEALPPKQFRARANALCTGYYADLVALAKRIRPRDLASLAAFQRAGHARAVRFVRQLKQLIPPSALAAKYRRFIALLEKSNTLDGPIVAAASRGDTAALSRLLAREAALDRPLLLLARSLSLTACASPPR